MIQPKTRVGHDGRVCTGECGKYKLWAHYYPIKKGAKEYRAICKECIKSGSKASFKKVKVEGKKREYPAIDPIGRICTMCPGNTFKKWVEFGVDKSSRSGRKAHCLECNKEVNKRNKCVGEILYSAVNSYLMGRVL